MKILIIFAAFFLITFCSAVFADTIYLNDGTSFEGEIIGIDGNLATIKTPESTFKLNKYKIKRIERDKEEDKNIDKERSIEPGTPQWDLKWD